jgi:hypothetical protein
MGLPTFIEKLFLIIRLGILLILKIIHTDLHSFLLERVSSDLGRDTEIWH